jgi:hypothetical protein
LRRPSDPGVLIGMQSFVCSQVILIFFVDAQVTNSRLVHNSRRQQGLMTLFTTNGQVFAEEFYKVRAHESVRLIDFLCFCLCRSATLAPHAISTRVTSTSTRASRAPSCTAISNPWTTLSARRRLPSQRACWTSSTLTCCYSAQRTGLCVCV